MGVGQSKNSEILKYFERQWIFLKEQNGIKVLRNQETDKQAQMVPLLLDPRRDINNEYEIYNYRRTQENALVSVYAVQNSKNNQNTMCGNTQILKIVLQRIPLRYRDLVRITFQEALYVLSETIRGFDDCFSKIGQFQITNRMIGINPKGMIKVWLNENFADNHPSDERPMLQMTCANEMKLKMSRQQLIMLQNLLNVVEEKCQSGRFPQDFRSKIYGKSNFVDAYSQIEMYCKDKNMQIPDRIMLPSQINTINSISLQKSKTQIVPNFVSSQYEPRQTLIKNLSISQLNNDNKQYYIQSPQLRKYDLQQQRQYFIPQKTIQPLPQYFVPQKTLQPLPSRLSEPNQIKFNYNPSQIRFNNFSTRF